jgi:TonB family protein
MRTGIIACVLLGLVLFPTGLIAQVTQSAPPDEFTGYEKAPVPVSRVEPSYPGLALRAAIEGSVILNAYVNELGNVVDTRIVRSTQKIFEETAITAARQWKFTPATSHGKPVAVWVTIPFQFVLPSPSKGKSSDYEIFLESLRSIAMNIIQGRKLAQAKATVDPGAYIIDGNHYANLLAVLNGEVKTCKVVEGPDSEILFLNVYENEEMTTASMIIKTVYDHGTHERYHTVLIIRQPGGEWKIRSWHVSG